MNNFPNFYNEKKILQNTFNSWEYFFDPVSKYKLKDVYKSKNVIFSINKITKKFNYTISEKSRFLNLFKKYIKVKKKHLVEIEKIKKKKLIKNLKLLVFILEVLHLKHQQDILSQPQ